MRNPLVKGSFAEAVCRVRYIEADKFLATSEIRPTGLEKEVSRDSNGLSSY